MLIMLICCCLQEVLRRFPDGLPLLDPIEDMGIKDHDLKKLVEVRKMLTKVNKVPKNST